MGDTQPGIKFSLAQDGFSDDHFSLSMGSDKTIAGRVLENTDCSHDTI